MMQRLLGALLFLGVIVANATSLAGASSQPQSGLGIKLLSPTASKPSDPRARTYIVDHLAPGTISHRQVEVANSTNSTMNVAVYPAAAAVVDGSFTFGADRAVNDLTTWIAVDRGALAMRPRAKVVVSLTFSVPRDAAPGERFAVIWAEVRSVVGSTGVVVVNRVGVRVYLWVG